MGRPKGSKNKARSEPIAETIDEAADKEKARAAEKGLEDPEFDYRQIYSPGQCIYYVYVNTLDGTKEVQELTTRTIYARSLIAYEDGGMCRCISYQDRDMIYLQRQHAEEACRHIKVTARYKGDDLT